MIEAKQGPVAYLYMPPKGDDIYPSPTQTLLYLFAYLVQ